MNIQDKIHVCIVPSWYPTTQHDISGSFFREQAIALSSSGLRVGVISPKVLGPRKLLTYLSIKNKCRETHEIDKGVNTYRTHCLSLIPRSDYYYAKAYVRGGVALFKSYVKDNGYPDLIHVHCILYGGLLGVELKKQFGIPFIITEHSSAYESGRISLTQEKLAKVVIKKASKCFAVSDAFSGILTSFFRNEVEWETIPNILSKDFESSPLVAKEENDNTFTFFNASYLTPNKGIDVLIKAFAKSFSTNSNVNLTIAGDGTEKGNLIQLAKKYGVLKQVNFLGMQSRKQVQELMSKSEAYVLSSHIETFGVVVIEAMAMGKPVISTKCGGPESLINIGQGVLVEKNNFIELSLGMLKVYEDYHQYSPELIRSSCLSRFSQSTVVAKIYQEYKHVLST